MGIEVYVGGAAVVVLLIAAAKLPRLRSRGNDKRKYQRATGSDTGPPDVGSPTEHRMPTED